MGIVHAFVSDKVDEEAGSGRVRPSDWNAEHVIDSDIDLLEFALTSSEGPVIIDGAVGAWLRGTAAGEAQIPFVIGNDTYSATGHNGQEMGFEVWTRNPVSGEYLRNMACHVGDVNDNVVTVFYKHVDFKGILEYHADLGEEISTRFIQATANDYENHMVNRFRTQDCGFFIDLHKDGGTFRIRKNTTNDTGGGQAQVRGYADWNAGLEDALAFTAATGNMEIAGGAIFGSNTYVTTLTGAEFGVINSGAIEGEPLGYFTCYTSNQEFFSFLQVDYTDDTGGSEATDLSVYVTHAGAVNIKVVTYSGEAATYELPVGLKNYVKASLPSAAVKGRMIHVTNETGGEVPCFSDGTNWRRVTDRAIVS